MMLAETRHNTIPNSTIKINNMEIKFFCEMKYLVYLFTPNNNEELQIKSLYRELCVSSNAFFRNFRNWTDDVKCLLF